MRTYTLGLTAALSLQSFALHADPVTIVDTGEASFFMRGSTPALLNSQRLAAEFSTTQPYTITSIEGWMGCVWRGFPCGPAGDVTVRISGDGGDVPGSSIHSQTTFLAPTARQLDPFMPAAESGSWQGVFGLAWPLAPGTYWVVFEVPVESQFFWLMGGATNPLVNEAFALDLERRNFAWIGFDELDLAVRIVGTATDAPVPEPASVLLFASGFAAIGTRVWTARRRPRASGTTRNSS